MLSITDDFRGQALVLQRAIRYSHLINPMSKRSSTFSIINRTVVDRVTIGVIFLFSSSSSSSSSSSLSFSSLFFWMLLTSVFIQNEEEEEEKKRGKKK
jgi:hypothetical protein